MARLNVSGGCPEGTNPTNNNNNERLKQAFLNQNAKLMKLLSSKDAEIRSLHLRVEELLADNRQLLARNAQLSGSLASQQESFKQEISNWLLADIMGPKVQVLRNLEQLIQQMSDLGGPEVFETGLETPKRSSISQPVTPARSPPGTLKRTGLLITPNFKEPRTPQGSSTKSRPRWRNHGGDDYPKSPLERAKAADRVRHAALVVEKAANKQQQWADKVAERLVCKATESRDSWPATRKSSQPLARRPVREAATMASALGDVPEDNEGQVQDLLGIANLYRIFPTPSLPTSPASPASESVSTNLYRDDDVLSITSIAHGPSRNQSVTVFKEDLCNGSLEAKKPTRADLEGPKSPTEMVVKALAERSNARPSPVSSEKPERTSRRARHSGSYAEPNLRDKMRRERNELFNAVLTDGPKV